MRYGNEAESISITRRRRTLHSPTLTKVSLHFFQGPALGQETETQDHPQLKDLGQLWSLTSLQKEQGSCISLHQAH